MNENFFDARKGDVVLRKKIRPEQPTKGDEVKNGLVAEDILRKLKEEARQDKAQRLEGIKKETERLNEIFRRKDRDSSN